ncbi:hypothetical protein EDE05_11789 [Neorhizobium sp. R1-B]|nr:hypothetical protein EDE05_11789 [Neorhizobium sp. R1-B]
MSARNGRTALRGRKFWKAVAGIRSRRSRFSIRHASSSPRRTWLAPGQGHTAMVATPRLPDGSLQRPFRRPVQLIKIKLGDEPNNGAALAASRMLRCARDTITNKTARNGPRSGCESSRRAKQSLPEPVETAEDCPVLRTEGGNPEMGAQGKFACRQPATDGSNRDGCRRSRGLRLYRRHPLTSSIRPAIRTICPRDPEFDGWDGSMRDGALGHPSSWPAPLDAVRDRQAATSADRLATLQTKGSCAASFGGALACLLTLSTPPSFLRAARGLC